MNRVIRTTIVAVLCVPAPSAAQRSVRAAAPGTAVICSQTATSGLNPAVSPDLIAGDLRGVLFTTPMRYGDRGDLQPYALTKRTWSTDKKTLTLELRSDLHWHDGSAVTAEDLAWTLRAAADRQYGIRNAHDLASLKDARASGPTTVVAEFSTPAVGDLEVLATLPILPKHLLASVPAAEFARADYHRTPIGSGPFRFVSRSADNTLTFERFDRFPQALGRPRVERVLLRAIPEIASAVVELKTGGVDMCITGSSVIEQLRNARQLRFLGIAPAGVAVIPLNVTTPILRDVRVRRALSAALRRSDIAAITSPVARSAGNLLPLGHTYMDPALNQPDNNPALASRLLDQAGWKRSGKGVRRNAAGQELRLHAIAPQQLAGILTIVQSQWRSVGVELDVRLMEWAAYVSNVLMKADGRPDAMALGLFPDRLLRPDYYEQLHSTSPRNLSSFAKASVDTVLQRLRTEPEAGTRRELYRALQRAMQDEVPTLYLIYTPRLAAIGPRLENVQFDLNGAFSSVTRWNIRR